MHSYNAILKKRFVEWRSRTKSSLSTGLIGLVLTLLVTALFMFVIVTILMQVVSSYTTVMYNGVRNPIARQHELLSIFYMIIIVLGVLGSLRQFNKFIFFNDDLKIYATMPIKPSTLFFSAMLFIYLGEFVATTIYTITVNSVFASVVGNVQSIVPSALLMGILLPALSIAIASIIAVPVYYLQQLLRTRYLLTLMLVTALVGVGFWAYSGVLDVFSEMLVTGEIKFFFSQKVMDTIINVSNNLYPAVYYADFTLGINRGINIAIILALTIGSLIIGMLIINTMLNRIIKNKMQLNTSIILSKKHSQRELPLSLALMKKEFINTFRTPSYAFQYFSTAIMMPLMIVLCMKLSNDFVISMVGFNCNFELAIFCTFIFSMLTNTYCATNISRDGDAFALIKSYPITPKRYVMTKVLVCSIISFLSTLVSTIVIGAIGYISAVQAVFVCVSSCMFALSEICFATHLDLASPHFSNEADGEVKESNTTIVFVIILGILASVVVGGASLFVRIIVGLQGKQIDILYTYLIAGLLSLVLLVINIVLLVVRTNKLYSRIEEG